MDVFDKIVVSVLKAVRRGEARRAGYAWTPRRQSATVTQGELGPPGHLGDAFKTLIIVYTKAFDSSTPSFLHHI